jgi:hypothetical protein
MEATMSKLRKILSAFSECWTGGAFDDAILELDLDDQEIAEELYRRGERGDTGDRT